MMLNLLLVGTALDPMKGVDVKDPRAADVELLIGGPDGYGYIYLSTQDGDTGLTFNYIDITSTGIAVGATDDWCSGYNASTLYP
ncbi:MAG: hypothetical protein GXO39_02165, partial [Thermotogae bacterium]|nr:hypothetical protein [Thermotogota bacterium]